MWVMHSTLGRCFVIDWNYGSLTALVEDRFGQVKIVAHEQCVPAPDDEDM